MTRYCRGLSQRQAFLLLTVLALLFILFFVVKDPRAKDSRRQFILNNDSSAQEILQKAEPQGPIMTLSPRVHNKETTSVSSKNLKKQEREASQGEQGEGKEKRKLETIRPAPENPQSKAEPAAKMPVPEYLDKLPRAPGVLSTRKTPMATGAVPAKKKVVQATKSPASSPHPTTRRRQRLKASEFKSEPRWDFEEEYSLDMSSLQTNCSASVKIKASKSPWLQNIFLPNITLFLDSGRFTQSEWNRLEHFAPPFGFMELNQSLVQKVVTRFPPVRQQQLLLASLPTGYSKCITCAVVGNGGILNDSRVGQEIDSHDYVFRHRPQEAFRNALDLDRYLLLHPDFLRYMKNRFLRSKTLDTAHWRIYRPTTGALLLLTALHICDKVSAYGFITEGHQRFSDHYYDTSWKRLIFYINHDFRLERMVWKRLHDEGIIWLYQRPQSDKAKN